MVDAHCKWPEVIGPMKTTADPTINAMRNIFARYGLLTQVTRTSLSFLLHGTVPALLLYSQHFLFKEWNEIPLKVRNSESIGSFRNPVLYLLAKF